MKIFGYPGFLFFIQITCITNTAYAITPSQSAAINIWLQQEKDVNPRPLSIIYTLNKSAKKNNINIIQYSINSKEILIKAKTRIKSNILQYKRILDTTFMFDEISIKTTKYRNKKYYFSLIFKKSDIDKRESYMKSEYEIFKSKTQIKYSIINLIKKLKASITVKFFCPATPLKTRPNYLGARLKLIIYSYKIKISGSFEQIKKTLNNIEHSANYISMHNLILVTHNNTYNLDAHLRFYQLGNRRNSLDKSYVFERVKTDKICE